MKKWLTVLFIGIIFSLSAEDKTWVEKTKTLVFTYDSKDVDRIDVTNKFGNVKVMHWNKHSVKVNVNIRANAVSNALTEKYLDNIQIKKEVKNKVLSLQTHMSDVPQNQDKKNSYCTVDYLIYMPENTQLRIENSFGNISLPEFFAPLMISLQHGNLDVPIINNAESQLNIKFGKAVISELVGARINSANSNVDIQVLKDADIKFERGVLTAQDVENIKGKIKYAKSYFNNLNQMIELDVAYTTDLRLGNLNKDLKQLKINTTYSDIQLADFNGLLNVITTNGQVYLGQGVKAKTLPPPAPMVPPAKNVQVYKALIGKESDKVVIINANHSNVKVKN